jgi:hypothetical protein
MKKLVGILEPFQQTQYLHIYEDGNKIDIVESDIDNFVTNAVNLIEQYKISDISIKGPKKYAKNFGEQIKQSELTNYNNSSIEVKYL